MPIHLLEDRDFGAKKKREGIIRIPHTRIRE
jgi:hypothetical protein